jgi:type II secretory pathway predicted ATPase ExeA
VAKTSTNPFKPGAGHSPPHLAGREKETEQFAKLLDQEVVIQNVILTGLRGVGKTVLMDDVYKPLSIKKNWAWVGSDFSEAAFVSESSLCSRLLTDLSLFTSQIAITEPVKMAGFHDRKNKSELLSFEYISTYFEKQPGLMVDKLKATLEFVWQAVQATDKHGIVFAYDEAQVVQDQHDKEQYPLALLLEAFQSIQRKGMRFLLLLTGLPTLFPKLIESRTYAERMFIVQDIGRLETKACKEAIKKPLDSNAISFTPESVSLIVEESKCYPYFIQFICREAYDYFKACIDSNPDSQPPALPIKTLIRKLDTDFFSGRWQRVTDRQRELLLCVASLDSATDEFTIYEIVEQSKDIAIKKGLKPFKTADVGQMIPKLIDAGLLYKTRYGKYCFAVPLFDAYILRHFKERHSGRTLFDDF